jgi:RND family efflux transporter MFP subunit
MRPGPDPFTRRAAAAVAILIAAGCGGGEGGGAPGGAVAGGPGGGRPGADRVVPVEALPVESGRIARSVSVSGVVEPITTVAVRAQLAGALRSVEAEEGTVVAAGQVLARVDDREIQAQLASAEAALQVAEAAWQRAERLRERQVITAAEYERDRAAYAAAQSQVEQLRTRAGFATVTAPIAGVITEKLVETGDVVSPNTQLFALADVSTMVVRVRVSELDVVALRPGDEAGVVLDAFPAQPLRGRIRRVFPTADPQSRLVPVEVALTGADARVARPGFLARVTFALGARENVRLVPASAIVSDATGLQAVFVIDNDRATRRTVRTGLTSEGRVEIVDGVDVGEWVVVTGTSNLRDGTSVRIVNPGAAPGGVERRTRGAPS